jgi:hypothetical protein
LKKSGRNSPILTHQFSISSESLREEEELMCPACIANAALVAGSVMSTGGIAALAAKMVASKKSVPNENSKKMTERRNDHVYIERGEDDGQQGTGNGGGAAS